MQFAHLGWIHDGLGGPEQNLDDHFGGDVLTNESDFASSIEEPAEMAANDVTSAAFHQLEQVRRFTPDVSYEGRMNFLGVVLDTGEELMQRARDIRRVRGDAMEICLDGAKFLDQYGLQQGVFARKAAIERLFAHAEVFGEIVHCDVAEAVRQEMAPSRGDDPPGDQRFPRASLWVCCRWHKKPEILIKYYQFPRWLCKHAWLSTRPMGRMTAASCGATNPYVAWK